MNITLNLNKKIWYNTYVDPVVFRCIKIRGIFIEKTEPERGVLPTVLLNPRDCIIAGSTRASLSGF